MIDRMWEVDKTPKIHLAKKNKEFKTYFKNKGIEAVLCSIFRKGCVLGVGARHLCKGNGSELRRHKQKSSCVLEWPRAVLVQCGMRA